MSMNKHKHMVLKMCSQHGMGKGSRYSSCDASTHLWKSNQTDFISLEKKKSAWRAYSSFICRNEDFIRVTPFSQPKKATASNCVFLTGMFLLKNWTQGFLFCNVKPKGVRFSSILCHLSKEIRPRQQWRSPFSRALRSRVSLPTVITATVESFQGV